MPEGGGFSPIDSSNFVYVPARVKLIAAALLVIVLVVSLVASVIFAMQKHNEEMAIYALSLSQVCVLIIVVGLVAVYSEREAGIALLQDKADRFLDSTLLDALSRITVRNTSGERTHHLAVGSNHQDARMSEVTPTSVAHRDIFGRLYHCTLEGSEGHKTIPFKMWVGLNVFRLFTIYFVDYQPENERFKAHLDGKNADLQSFVRWLQQDVFAFTFGGAERIGYHTNYEVVDANELGFVSIWLSVEANEKFLTNPAQKLFWSQDIAMMTESFLRTGLRQRLNLHSSVDPGPL